MSLREALKTDDAAKMKAATDAALHAGFSVLAFEADKTIVMDLEEVVKLADKHKICLCAV